MGATRVLAPFRGATGLLAPLRAIADFLRPAEAIGILSRGESGSRLSGDPLVLTDVGRAALIVGLRTRALAPATGPR